MNKKMRFWMCAASGVVLTAVVAWSCRSEYGSGYSEDQRRNWNEMVEKVANEKSAHMDAINGWNSSEFSHALNERQSQSDAPAWKWEIPVKPVELSLEGMSLVALTRLADQGDGDACLELVFRYCGKSGEERSRSAVYQGEKYLKKAVDSGRPGADFLLRFLQEWKKRGNSIPVEDVAGYRAFLSHLNAGDFWLGKVYFYLIPEGGEGLDALSAGLKKKAVAGDVVAMRNRGHLKLLKMGKGEETSWLYNFFDQSTREGVSWWLEGISTAEELLPASIKPEERTMQKMKERAESFISSWYMKKARRRLKEPLDLLMAAAEQGDIHAKFLWTQYSVWGGMPFSRKEWEAHLRYTDDLLKAGGRYTGNDPLSISSGDAFPIRHFFYKKTE